MLFPLVLDGFTESKDIALQVSKYRQLYNSVNGDDSDLQLMSRSIEMYQYFKLFNYYIFMNIN